MEISVQAAIARLDQQGMIQRSKETFLESMIAHAAHAIGQPLPAALEALYRERVKMVGQYPADLPHRYNRMGFGYRGVWCDHLLPARVVPIFMDGCGNEFALDLSSGDAEPAVYFFDHELGWEKPQYAVGSTLGRFLILLSLYDKSLDEEWETGWELEIDPDIDNCPRARAIWNAG